MNFTPGTRVKTHDGCVGIVLSPSVFFNDDVTHVFVGWDGITSSADIRYLEEIPA